ncbi:hypothetical protein BRCON_1558 [Candidatus Sumerlaea chitinivorans]|uniref:Uncharacterized protein n=1 Tax=Sumerlaea chitinivorans TaxID=2250252 RepID=A0A2Z4Y7F1_SUMC1|nr:hypothetical protein BRCON_1558 [Candidatus Sumerlaea chitinivorans]
MGAKIGVGTGVCFALELPNAELLLLVLVGSGVRSGDVRKRVVPAGFSK